MTPRCLVTVERVEGYGEHPNFFHRNLMHDDARLVLYADHLNVNLIVNLSNGDDVTASSLEV